MKKIKRVTIVLSMFICIFCITAFANAGSYTSTYEMTGGVFSKWIHPTSKCTITVYPKSGTDGQDMGVIWAKKTALGWDGKQKWTSSTQPGTVTFKSSKKRKVWLRNYTGFKWTGSVSFTWD